MMPTDLTKAERSVWAAFRTGAWVDLSAGDQRDDLGGADLWGPERIVRAKVIATLLLGAVAPEPGYFPAVRLRGARIAGRLDVTGASVACSLTCESCWFDTAPRFVESTTKTVRLIACSLPGFDGTRMHTEGILNFNQTRVRGVLCLNRASVAGEVCLSRAVIEGANGEAVAARGLTVSGDLDCTEIICSGPVRLSNARLDGAAQLTGAQISAPAAPAVDATNAMIGAGLDGDRMIVQGETRLRHTRIAGSLRLAAAQLSNSSGAALGAGGLAAEAVFGA